MRGSIQIKMHHELHPFRGPWQDDHFVLSVDKYIYVGFILKSS